MTLSVIGAGFGRTGTYTLNLALEALGLGPCHHMEDVNASDFQTQFWRAAGKRQTTDWESAYAGFSSAVDWPTAYFWRQLAEHYPKAKIILTRRDPDAWFKSFSQTIGVSRGRMSNPDSFGVAVIGNRIFRGRMDDPEHCKAVYEAHNAAVIATIPAERLLVYDVRDGWPELCAFLNLPIPAEPFPVSNSTEEFRAKFAPPVTDPPS